MLKEELEIVKKNEKDANNCNRYVLFKKYNNAFTNFILECAK